MLKPEYLFHCVKAGREEYERAEDGSLEAHVRGVTGNCTDHVMDMLWLEGITKMSGRQ